MTYLFEIIEKERNSYSYAYNVNSKKIDTVTFNVIFP